MPLIVDGIVGTTWSTWRRKAITICALISTATGAIIGVAKAAPIVEPWLYASRGYVRDDIHHPLLNRIIEIQLAQNDARADRLVEKAKQYELELQSPQAQQLPQYRALLQERVDRTNHELKIIDEKNNSLFKEKVSK